MTYNRDEVVASVTDFYTFLTAHLHSHPSESKIPPPGGWPQITAHRFAFLHKSDAVIDLLRHLPYLPGSIMAEKWIYDHTICADYTGEWVERDVQSDCPYAFEPEDITVEKCPFEELRDANRKEHIVTLATPEIGDAGCFVFLDTLDGNVAIWDVDVISYLGFDSAAEYFTWLREQYEELEIFPVPNHVVTLSDKRHGTFKEAIRSLGWLPKDGSGWRREEGWKEVEKSDPKYA